MKREGRFGPLFLIVILFSHTRQYIAYKHHGKIPLKGVETIEVPLSRSIE